MGKRGTLTAKEDYLFSSGHIPWNKGTGGCKKGHDPNLYRKLPSGICVCLACKRDNGAKYREANRDIVQLKSRLARYGVSYELFQELWVKQGGKCAICQTEFDHDPEKKKKWNFRIDHDHETDEIRGLLCVSCNTGIGLLKDSVWVLESATRYLSKGK